MHECQGPCQPAPEQHDLLHRQLLPDFCVLREIFAQGPARQVIEDQVFGALGSPRVVEGHDVVVPAGQCERFGLAVESEIGFAASDERQLGRAVEQSLALRGPCLIEARIDPGNYGRTLRAVRG